MAQLNSYAGARLGAVHPPRSGRSRASVTRRNNVAEFGRGTSAADLG